MLKKVMQFFLVLTLVGNVFATTKDEVRDNYLKDSLSLLLYDHLYLVTKNLADGTIHYTRSVNFKFNPSTGLITHGNEALQGYAMSGSKKHTNYVDIKIPINDVIPPQASTLITFDSVNLSASDRAPSNTNFSQTNPVSYNLSSVSMFYDTNGNPHTLLIYYVKTTTPNTWKIYLVMGDNTIASGTATFNAANGTLSQITGLNNIIVHIDNRDQNLKLDLSAITQYGTQDNPGIATMDGYNTGNYSGFAIDGFGVIFAEYTNGMSNPVSKIAMINN